MEMKELQKQAEKIRSIWHRPYGLLGALLLEASFLIGACAWAHPVARDDLKILTEPTHHFYFFGITALLFVITGSLTASMWHSNRRLPRLPEGKPSIIFALSAEKQSDDLIKQVYEGFRKETSKRNLGETILYKVLPKNLEVHNHDQAKKVLSESSATIVVFGEYKSGNRNSKNSEQFQSLSFHWRGNAPLNEREQALVAAMEQFPFRINEADSLDHTPRARQGFANLTLFFVALSLTSIGNSIDARVLWKDLLKREKNVRSKRRNISVYRNWWARNEFVYAQYIYSKYVEAGLTDPNVNPHAEDMIEALDDAKGILKSYPGYYMLRAIAEFHLGDPKTADKTAREGLKRFSNDVPATVSFNLSLGFITLWRRLYDRSIRYYHSVSGYGYPREDAIRIVQFVQTVLDRYPDRPELNFVVAYIRDNFGLSNSTSDYEYFFDQAAGVSGIEKLVEYAEGRIRRINSNQSRSQLQIHADDYGKSLEKLIR